MSFDRHSGASLSVVWPRPVPSSIHFVRDKRWSSSGTLKVQLASWLAEWVGHRRDMLIQWLKPFLSVQRLAPHGAHKAVINSRTILIFVFKLYSPSRSFASRFCSVIVLCVPFICQSRERYTTYVQQARSTSAWHVGSPAVCIRHVGGHAVGDALARAA